MYYKNEVRIGNRDDIRDCVRNASMLVALREQPNEEGVDTSASGLQATIESIGHTLVDCLHGNDVSLTGKGNSNEKTCLYDMPAAYTQGTRIFTD